MSDTPANTDTPPTSTALSASAAPQTGSTGWLGTGLPSWAPFMAILIGTVVIGAALRRRHRTMTAGERELLQAAGAVRALPRPVERRPGGPSDDLRTAAEDAIARLDDKAAVLQRLIREADTRIARLERAERGNPHSAHENPRASHPPHCHLMDEPSAGDMATDPLIREIYALADEGLSHTQIAKRLGQHQGHVGLVLALRR